MRKKVFLMVLLICGSVFSFAIFRKGEKILPVLPSVLISQGSVLKGGTLYECLKNEGLSNKEIWQIEKTLKPIFDFRKCSVKDKYEIIKSTEGVVQGFKYYSGINIYEVIKASASEFVAHQNKIRLDKTIVGISGKVTSSLWESMHKQGISPEVILNFADIFSWQIDFLTETQNGDTYRLVWEKYSNGNVSMEGKVLAAQYYGENGSFNAVYFKDGYYNLNGESLQKQFLRAPLNFRRISSYFTNRRFHPILKYWRPHLGIDYAAPIGTPIVSVADGVIIYKGTQKGYGKFIKIRHNSVYQTTYGHLNGYAKTINKGVKVKQGQVVGYVGSTGMSTGPHLDFRMVKNGSFVNFLRLKFPAKKKIDKKNEEEFSVVKKERLSQIGYIFNVYDAIREIELRLSEGSQ